jgi:hypothetical protein
VSENGNETMVRNGIRITVFPRSDGWAYASAPVDREDAHFSGDFETHIQAKQAALFDEFGIGVKTASRQELRARARRNLESSSSFKTSILSDLKKLENDVKAATAKVEKVVADSAGPPRVKTLKK